MKQLAGEGATGADSLDAMVAAMPKPRAIWIMVPAGGPTESTVDELAEKLEPGDTIIDGGNSFFKDDIRRAKALAAKKIHYVDAGTSGGVYGLERGYCLMIGGDKEVVQRLDPIFKTLAPGRGDVERTPGREKVGGTAEEGYLHCGPVGSGHFVKMVHNGIEYGIMQAIAEGFDIMKRRERTRRSPRSIRFAAAGRRHRRGLAARQRAVVVADRSDREGAGRGSRRSTKFTGNVAGLRRGPVDRDGGDRGGRAGRRDRGVAVHAVPVAPGPLVRREGAVGDALPVRRPRRAPDRRVMRVEPLSPISTRSPRAAPTNSRARAKRVAARTVPRRAVGRLDAEAAVRRCSPRAGATRCRGTASSCGGATSAPCRPIIPTRTTGWRSST